MVARSFLTMAALVAIVAGCSPLDGNGTVSSVAPPELIVVENAPSPASVELAQYYERVEKGHRARGLLRTDGGGPDVPFDAERLAMAFRATAFAREFSDQDNKLVQSEAESRLHRWEQPVLIQTMFGTGVSDPQRADDMAAIARYAGRLQDVTQHPIRFVERGGNFQVLVLTEDERRVIGPLLTRLVPSVRPREIELIETLDRGNYCVVIASDPRNDGAITQAVAIVRAELPPLLRLSCFHEEIAQGLGLSNDSQTARPSIFNDDDEFGRLTVMDEKMLRLLYDNRLKPGMDAASADAIVSTLARDLTGSAL